ncbi:hypothetical protein D6D01_05214 [Aureobasidium pullulans]|uniref:Uncharacterized protein n=1 Tax=Aureobasidium pullulans TaxID=5580 RepID=A0A4S9L929_AURPU|nr:hypothetical protein D6D01_05214 [Aureobasidium pullulans]
MRLALMATNVQKAGRGCDDSLAVTVAELLHEAVSCPLKTSRKRKSTKEITDEGEKDDEVQEPKRKKENTVKKVLEDATIKTPPTLPQTPRNRTTTKIQIQNAAGLTPSKKGNDWRTTWSDVSSSMSPDTKDYIEKVLAYNFSLSGANNVLEMAEQIVEAGEDFELSTASSSIAQLSRMDSPARAAAIRWKFILDEGTPKRLQEAKRLLMYVLVSQDIANLEHQALQPSTPFGKLFAEDRGVERRRVRNDRTAAAFVLDHFAAILYPNVTGEQLKQAKTRLTKDRDIAANAACCVEVFGRGVIPLMSGSSWLSASVS